MATVSLTAQDVYAEIKKFESTFPLPAPYVTVNVGTFDAAAGTFQGLKTKVVTDPEPIEHAPNQHPVNPPAKFVGSVWEEVTIDAHWHRTIKTVPAPSVPLAPVLLEFAVANTTAAWSVTVAGLTTPVPAGQASVSVSIWDRTNVGWTIQAGGKSYGDEILIQRKAGIPGAGAFTIPVIPVSIVYAPPVDSLKKSVASYGTTDTVGNTVSYDFSTDSSQTVPKLPSSFEGFDDFKSGLDVISKALSLAGDAAASSAISQISTNLGSVSGSGTTGETDASGMSLTVIVSASELLATNANAGGPGVGDVLVFYKDVQVAWAYEGGALQLCPFAHEFVTIPVGALQANAHGLSSDDVQRLLALDPFVAGGPSATLPPDRFTVPDGGEVNLEYGGGVTIDQKLAKTRDTKSTTTTKTYTTDTSSWDPGPMLKLLGIGGQKTSVTTTQTNATADDVSSTISLEANLFAGPSDYFAVTIWYDQLFGTFAFQEVPVAAAAIVSGTGAQPGALVRLQAGNRAYVTVANKSGHYGFRSKSIANGEATLKIGNKPATTVTVHGGWTPPHPTPPKPAPHILPPVTAKGGRKK